MCIFCDIVTGKIPSYKLYEDEQVLAFLDISQVCKGHTLVIPKQHFDTFLACDEDTLQHLMVVAQRIGNHLMKECQASGMNILSNVHEVAGQSVKHFHIHLIPRYGDGDACVIQFQKSAPQDLATLVKQLSL